MIHTNKRDNQKPSLILFDMDETLLLATPKLGEFVHRQVSALGITIEPERMKETERWLLYYWLQPAHIRGDPQINKPEGKQPNIDFWYDFLQLHVRMLGVVGGALERIVHTLLEPISTFQTSKALALGAIATLEHLSVSGYRLGLMSNRIEPIHEIAHAMGIADYFDLIYSGGEIGFLKPDPRFFFVGLDQLDTSPAQAVYIGDNYYADVVGAQFAGLTPILIDPINLFPNAGCRRISDVSELIAMFDGSPNE